MMLFILGFASLTHLLVDFISTLDTRLPNKPFKCDLCMGFWISVIPALIQYNLTGVLVAAITAITADLIFRIKNSI